jgi:hypothetical protein
MTGREMAPIGVKHESRVATCRPAFLFTEDTDMQTSYLFSEASVSGVDIL